MENSKRKISPLTQENDATSVRNTPVVENGSYSRNLKRSVQEQRQRKILEERQKFANDFKAGNYEDYPALKAEAERQRKRDDERKKAEKKAREEEEANVEVNRQKAWNEFDSQQKAWVQDQLDRNTALAAIAVGLGRISAPKLGKSGPRGILNIMFDIKNMFGKEEEMRYDGDYKSTLDELSRARMNNGAAEAHKQVLTLEQQRQDLVNSLDNWYKEVAPDFPSYNEVVQDLTRQIQDVDNSIAQLKDLDDLYKKVYVGERPLGFWNRVGEFFKDDLWEGIQDATTYDSAKEYTKNRRLLEVDKEYDRQLKEKGVRTGVNRMINSPTGITEDTDFTREWQDVLNFQNNTENIIDDLSKEAGQKLKALEDTKQKWNVSSGYNSLVEAYQNGDLLDPNYIFAEYAQMFGSSMSSKEQLAATGIRMASFAGSVAAGATGNAWLAPWILNATEIGLTPLDYAGAVQENDIERAEKYISNIEAYIKNRANGGEETYNRITNDLKEQAEEAYKNIGLSDEQIKRRLNGSDAEKNLLADVASGIIHNEDPVLKAAMLYANRGLDAQQDANNFRTVSDLVLQKSLVWLPINAKASIGNKVWASVDRAAERAVSNEAKFTVEETAKKTLRSRLNSQTAKGADYTSQDVLNRYERIYGTAYKNGTLSNSIRKGYKTGVETGAALGYGLAGQHIAGAVGASVNSAVHLARTQLSPNAQRLLSQIERFGARKYQAIYDKLLGDNDFAKLALTYGYKQAKVNTLSALSEGAEESAQYIHENDQSLARKYGWDGMSLGDMIINDVTVGGEIMNAYLAMLGIGDSPYADDAEFWANWKGGAMLGFTNQSSLVNAAVRGQQDVIKQYNVDRVLTNAAIVNRELDDRDRAAYTDVVRQVLGNNTQYVLNYLDRMDTEESRRGTRVVSTEDINKTKKAVLEIAALANDKQIRADLEKSGIEYGSEDYITAIADRYALRNQIYAISEQRRSGIGERDQVYNSREFNEEIDEQVKVVNSQNAAYSQDKESGAKNAGDIAVRRAKEARKRAQEISSQVVPEEYSEYVPLTDEEKSYANMSDEEFNNKLGEIRTNAENLVMNTSDSLLREQLIKRAKAINRLTALLNIKAKFNTINGFFDYIHDNLKMSPMRPDVKTIMENIDEQIKSAKEQLREKDMSDIETLNYLRNGNIIGVSANQQIAIEIEQENAVLNAWSKVVYDHMSSLGTERYAKRVKAIRKARENNQKLNWMVSEIESGDAITRLQKQFAKEDAAKLRKDAKEAKKHTPAPSFEAPEKRTDGQISNIKSNKEEFERRRAQAKARKISRRNKYRKGGRLYAAPIPFMNVLLDIGNELLYAAEVGAYKFSEFLYDIKDWAKNNGFENIDQYTNDIKQFYIRYRAKANASVKANLDAAPEVIKFFDVQLPPAPPSDNPRQLTLQQKIQQQSDNIAHDVSSHFDIIFDDGTTKAIYTNKEAIKYAKYDENQFVIDITNKLKTANTSKESFEAVLTTIAAQYPGFPVQRYVEYRSVDGIEQAIARNLASYAPNTYVKTGIIVRQAVQAIMEGSDSSDAVQFFGDSYNEFKDQINKISSELGASLTLISTPDYLLYTDDDGNKRAALADIVFTDDSGAMYIIDVRSTIYPSVLSHYTYISKRGFSIEDQVKDTLKEADDALYKLSGARAKGLYMLPIVVGMNHSGEFNAISVTVEYKDGKALFKVKDRSNPELSDNIDELKKSAKEVVDEINDKIREYNDAIDNAGSYNIKYGKLSEEEFVEQESAALYDVYLRNLGVKLEEVKNGLSQLNSHVYQNISLLNVDIPNQLFGNIDEKLINTPEAVENLKECAKELDAAYEQLKDLGLLVMKATTYDERVAMDAFISALIDTQVALDIALSNEESAEYDFTNECTLIAAALQDVAKHRENFGKAGIAVKNWWVNNFAYGVKNNTTGNITSVGEQYHAYINTINNWINTFQEESEDGSKWVFKPELRYILDEPRNADIRRLYTSMMHNGFAKLINNFKAVIAADPNYDGSSDPMVAFAERMINQFDLAWGTEEDQDITNNPQDEVQRLQNLSVKWRDLYSESEYHSPAYASNPNDNRSMSQSAVYALLSKQEGFPNNCKFELAVKNGDLGIWVTGKLPDGRTGDVWLPFLSTPYPGITPKDARRMSIVNRGNLKFIDKAKALIEYAKKHPEYKVTFDVSTNKGSIRYDDINSPHNVQEWLLAGKDLYTIKLSKQDGIGLLRVTITEQNGKLYYVYGGDQLRETVGQFDDEFRKQKINTNSGALVYFKGTKGREIGVTIEPVKIGEERAKLIANLIQKRASGITQEDGFSIDSLLMLMLYMKDPEGRTSKYNNLRHLVQINGPMVTIGQNQPANIFSERDTIVKLIADLNIVTDAEILNSFIQTSQLQCLQRVKQLVARGAQSVKLPIGITIQAEDVVHLNKVGANGTTWLGYMLRNGLLTTRAIGESFKQINISNLRLENKNNPSTTNPTSPVQQKSRVGKRLDSDLDLDQIFSGLNMIVQEDELVERTDSSDISTFNQNVEEYFSQVFGKDKVGLWKVLNEGIIRKLPTGYVVGLCTTDLMSLSRYAPEDAAWHEAFHRVLELLLTEEEREVFYNAYSKHFGVTDDRTIAEGLADMFVDFMNKVGMPKGGVFNKVKRFFKTIIPGIVVAKKLGYKNTKRLFAFFNDINEGKYRTREVSEENKKRFQEKFGGWLAYTIKNQKTGQKFEAEHIADSSELNDIVKSIGYYITSSLKYDAVVPELEENDDWIYMEESIISGLFKNKKKKSKDSLTIDEYLLDLIPEDVQSDLRGDNVAEENLTSQQRAFREVLQKDHIGALTGHISNYIESILGIQGRGRIQKMEDESDTNGEDFGENKDPQNLNIDRYDKASYEFSKLASVSNRVKLFFATIPYATFDDEGHIVEDLTKNQFGTPTFMPLEEVYGVLENDLADVKSIDELYEKLKKLSVNSPMHRQVFIKFHKLIYGDSTQKGIYGADQFGNIVCKDYDRESLAIQIVSALSSQKIDFIVALSENIGSEQGKDVRISSSSLERDARSLPKQWAQVLTSGQSQVFAQSRDKDGNLQFKDRQHHVRGQEAISQTVEFLQSVRTALSFTNGTVTIDGKDYNKDSIDGIVAIKTELVKRLHQMGILISDKAFDYMLLQGFGNTGAQGLTDCLNGVGGTDKFKPQSIDSFIKLLNSIVNANGQISEDVIQKGYPENGFIKQLAQWQGMYNRVTVQNMALGLNGKQLFSISQNSGISHIIQALNSGDLNNEVVKNLMKFNYNMSDGPIPIGSIILKAIKNGNASKITAHTYIGLKTDNFGDMGSEYTEEAEIDDYISKLTMLQEGYMLFPTLADKGTWLVLKGVAVKGMRLITSRKDGKRSVRCENPVQVTFVGEKPYIMPSDDVIDQMIEYAYTERAAIIQCMEDLKSMPNSAKIKNYHTANKNVPRDKNGKPKFMVEPNGTRFLQLSKVYVEENGKLVGKNLNDPKKSSKEMLADANKYFFDLPSEEQHRIMGLTLAVQAEHEIQKAIDLGLVEHYDLKKSWKTADGKDVEVSFDSSQNTLWNLRSSHLNKLQIDAITSELLKQIPDKDPNVGTWANIPEKTRNAEKLAKYEMVNGLAIASILADATFRHIISSQEVLRCFAGHPGMFKVEYTEAGIKNSTADIQKRLGGLVSTGEDNIQNIPGIPSTYVCAEVNDYEIASRSDVASDLKNMFVTSQVRNIYAILTGEWDAAYKMSKEQIFEEANKLPSESDEDKYYKKNFIKKLETAEKDGQEFAAMFDGGINVADGAAYITDTMCENLLRMRGAYNNKVKEAFDILRSDKAISWEKSRDAYKIIYDAVNIVTTKYTAYGFRDHTINGQSYSQIAVPYYNKYALFPLFRCVASGKLGNIYQKMLDEKVDMLMMTSAVKVGSCGAVSYDGNWIAEPFNKYEQSFGYLRRQLNTDPEEGDEITMGTQMIKICLQNLIGERSYIDSRTGRTITGDEILEDMMGAINNLSKIGENEVIEMFSSDGGQTVDPEKLANYLQEQLTSRNANKTLLEMIRPYTKDGKVNLHALSATSDASWIESILISTINKRVIDITTPGASYVQRSAFAMEAQEGEGSIQGDANLSKEINGGKRLQMLNPDGSMDCVISINFFDDLFDNKDMSFEEKRAFLIEHGIIGNKAKPNVVAYRIPTQAQSSIHALRVVDIIPAVKDTIILPEEFTRITGSDYDIDHLYLARYNYRMDKNGKLSNWMEKGSKKYYQNKLLGNMLTLLTDKDSINTTYKSIDSDVELPKGCSKKVQVNESLEAEPYNFGTLRAQVSVKNDFMSGKVSIGPFALNSTSHMLTSHYDVKFRPTIVTENTKIKGFKQLLDDDGNFISAWLSGYISGSVDNAKDPFLAKLNTNQFTYNMLNLLLRSGFGETAVWFCAQPIVRDMSAASGKAKSQFSKDNSNKGSGLSRKEFAIMQAVKKYVPESALTAQALNKWTTSTQTHDLWDRVHAINWIEQNRDVLEAFATNPSLQTVTVKRERDGQETHVQYSRDYVQQKVFFAWKSLEKYATALGGLVQHTKIDTRKHGKTIIEINRYLDEYNKIFNPDDPSKSIWDVNGLKDFARRTWIDQKTKAAISLPSFVLQNYTFSANPRFIGAVLEFGHLITEPGEQISSTAINKISRHLQTAVKSKYFVDYVQENLVAKDKDGNPTETASDHIKNLFIGPKSMSKRLTGLKLAIELNPNYKRLENNGLIRQLYSLTEEDKTLLNGELAEHPGFITILDNVDSSRINSDLLTDGWEDLLNDSDEYVRRFANDLIIYAFMSSGEFKGWSKLFKYVPASWITGETSMSDTSYSDYVENILSSNYDYTQHFDEIASNCFGDRTIVEQIPMKNADDQPNFIDQNNICKIGRLIDVTEIESLKPYILVKQDSEGRNTDAYNLYKLAGFKHDTEDAVYPVYIRMKKKGYSKKSNNVYEYRWDMWYPGNEKRIMKGFNVEAAVESIRTLGSIDMDNFDAAKFKQVYGQAGKNHVEESVSTIAPSLGPEAKINIYAGTEENADLSNFAKRPFVLTSVLAERLEKLVGFPVFADKYYPDEGEEVKNKNTYNSVEQAFQIAKIGFAFDGTDEAIDNATAEEIEHSIKESTPSEAKRLGRTIPMSKLAISNWDKFSSQIMKELIKASFEQNPQALQRLLSTGNATLTHIQDKGKWGKEFPKLLMEVREELRNEHTESNDTYDYSDWKYLEDSGYSGALEELGLPEKVRMNGGMAYRPHYNFGRIYLTENERQFIEERINIVDENGDTLNINANKLNSLIEQLSKLYDKLINVGERNVAVKYRDWKQMLQSNNGFEYFIEKAVIEDLKDWSDFGYDDLIGEYDKSSKTIQIQQNFYDMVKVLKDNFDVVKSISQALNDPNYYAVAHLLLNFENIYDAVQALNTDAEDFFYSNSYSGGFQLRYSYKDSRQQELFSDEDFALLNESGEGQSSSKEHEQC